MKGGTAINMFIWDMPRLSVDIDLTYIHFDDRSTALAKISENMLKIKENIINNIDNIQVATSGVQPNQTDKLLCVRGGVKVKIEVNTTMRGIMKPTTTRPTKPAVQEEFKTFREMNIQSDAEIFGGKICAALERQHPRDLFDIKQLFEIGGITEEIKEGFIMCLLSGSNPLNEAFKPNLHDQRKAFEQQFAGMTRKPFTYDDYKKTRELLIKEINNILSDKDKQLLLSFKAGEPDWSLSNIEQLQHLPAIKWKMLNINKLKKQDPKQHTKLMKLLEAALA